MPAPPPTRFDRDTAVEALGEGRFAARIDDGWWVGRGPHGGYVAAIVMRGLVAALGDPERAARSLTVHYTAPPRPGPAELLVAVERRGRSLSTLSARMTQGDRLVALALAAFSSSFPSALDYDDAAAPDVRGPEDARRIPDEAPTPGFTSHLDMRPALGGVPMSGHGGEALTGGWVRLAEPRPLDAVAMAFYADAWWPAPFARLRAPAAAPTVDLTVHFRVPLPAEEPEHDFLLASVRSDVSREGFFTEDGRLWSRDGTLLAESRQLALLTPIF